MSALALAAMRHGVRVTGCDLDDAAFGDLRAAGAEVSVGADPSHLDGVRAVVVTAAAHDDHPELVAARSHGVPIVPRKQALAELVNGGTLVALAGTHGKTTTTVMTTEALRAAGLHPSGLAGGRVASWGGNAWLDGDRCWVVEADEYDQAFLTLRPTIAVINNVEADHLECYGSVEAMEAAFVRFASGAERILVGTADSGSDRIATALGDRVMRFGLEDRPGLRVVTRSRDTSGSVAECHWPDGTVATLRLRVPGVHNLRNAAAALGVVHALGGDLAAATEALGAFTGVGRRFERLGERGGVLFIDDYAHHPTELVATLEAARQAEPGRRLVAVFQPHLFSRTREHGDAMGRALAEADLAVVTDIYPAREDPIPGVTGALVADAVQRAGGDVRYHATRDALVEALVTTVRPGDLLLTLGAGDITRVGPMVRDRLGAPS